MGSQNVWGRSVGQHARIGDEKRTLTIQGVDPKCGIYASGPTVRFPGFLQLSPKSRGDEEECSLANATTHGTWTMCTLTLRKESLGFLT